MTTVKFRLRRDTAANWASVNPTLGAGEPALETDTGKVKYGDGSTAWNSLPYFFGDLGAALIAIKALTPAANRYVYFTSGSAAALGTITTFGRSLLDDANATAARTTLDLQEIRTLTPTNGGTSNIAASTAALLIIDCNHSATIASHTFNLPTLLDGQVIALNSRAAITAVTMTAPQSGAPLLTTMSASGHASYRWNAAANYLFRVE